MDRSQLSMDGQELSVDRSQRPLDRSQHPSDGSKPPLVASQPRPDASPRCRTCIGNSSPVLMCDTQRFTTRLRSKIQARILPSEGIQAKPAWLRESRAAAGFQGMQVTKISSRTNMPWSRCARAHDQCFIASSRRAFSLREKDFKHASPERSSVVVSCPP